MVQSKIIYFFRTNEPIITKIYTAEFRYLTNKPTYFKAISVDFCGSLRGTYKQTNIMTHKQTNRPTDYHIDRQTD